MFASKNKRYTKNHAVVRLETPEPADSSAIVRELRERLGTVNAETDTRRDGLVSTVTVPRTLFRRMLRKDPELRALIAYGGVEVDETRSGRWFNFKRNSMSGPRKGSVYVKEVKGLDPEADLSSWNSLDGAAFADWMRDRFTEQGLKTATWAATLGGVAVIGMLAMNKATKMIEAYSDETTAMIKDDRGLANAVKRRSGERPSEAATALSEVEFTNSARIGRSTTLPVAARK